MIDYLPLYLRKSKIYQEIFNSEQKQIDLIKQNINDLEQQLNVETATWGLVFYEKELNIKTDLNKPLEERRSVIKSKLRGSGKVDRMLIKLVVDAFTNGDVEVTFDGKIGIKFTARRGIPPNMDDVINQLDEIKPAHLDIIFTYLYTTWDRFDSFNYTWDQLDALDKTWDEIEVM